MYVGFISFETGKHTPATNHTIYSHHSCVKVRNLSVASHDNIAMAIAKFMWLLIYIAVCFAVRDDEHLPLHEKMLNDLGLEFESDPEPRLRVLFFLLLKLIQHQPTQQAWSTESCCSASKSEHYSGTATDYPIKTPS